MSGRVRMPFLTSLLCRHDSDLVLIPGVEEHLVLLTFRERELLRGAAQIRLLANCGRERGSVGRDRLECFITPPDGLFRGVSLRTTVHVVEVVRVGDATQRP